VRSAVVVLSLVGCGTGSADLALHVVPNEVIATDVQPVLPEGAILARSVVRGDVGLGDDALLTVWADKEPRAFHAGVVHDGTLMRFPDLHAPGAAPDRIGAVMLVQVDADPAGEVVILLDRSESRPDRLLATASQTFETVVVDYTPQGFVRLADKEALAVGQSQPNEIRKLLAPGATGF